MLTESRRPVGRSLIRYTVVLEEEPDGGYAVSVPALPGRVSEGDTRAEALANIREAIVLYIEDCRNAGDPIPTEAPPPTQPDPYTYVRARCR